MCRCVVSKSFGNLRRELYSESHLHTYYSAKLEIVVAIAGQAENADNDWLIAYVLLT